MLQHSGSKFLLENETHRESHAEYTQTLGPMPQRTFIEWPIAVLHGKVNKLTDLQYFAFFHLSGGGK